MYDEIPVLKPSQKTRTFSAQPTIIESLPFIRSYVSFGPFIDFLKQQLPSVAGTKEMLYKYLITKFEEHPELLEPITDEAVLENNAGLLELLATSLFPVICHQQEYFALGSPYQFRVFYYTNQFRELFFDKKEQFLMLPDDVTMEELKSIQCSFIYDQVLEQFYGMKLNENRQLIYPLSDALTGMVRYYRIHYDRRFTRLHLKGELPPIQDCGVCMNTFRILDLEKQLHTMPLQLFEMEGFAVWVAEDITSTESIDVIKRILLREDCNTDVIGELKTAVKALVGINGVEVGIMPFVTINGQAVLDEQTCRHSLACRQWLDGSEESYTAFQEFVGFLKQQPTPMPVSNVNEEILGFATFLKPLYDEGTRSYLYYPMQNSDGLIGLLELSVHQKNVLTQQTMTTLEPAIPLLSLAMLKCRDGFDNRIEKLIREKFTALQQSVEWKFAEVAWEHLRTNDRIPTRTVMFEDVYPLYGAIDIRNSSLERSLAIQKDLKEHLQRVSAVLQSLQEIIQLPLLEGLEFKNETIRMSIEEKMNAEDELRVNNFIGEEVEPLFLTLQKTNSECQPLIAAYMQEVKEGYPGMHRHRRSYEASVAAINNCVLACLEEEEEIIQKSYPHYFEKYRTDGIEYNIYIGQSIAPAIPFEMFYLKNIRLWQLKVMATTARATRALLPSLTIPLETTQLILVHNLPISISFRRDERKFDVEGSYNIRYEIIKKRLDKVHVKETGERLTQPGKIAIVYSNQKEAEEYEEYIQFLRKKNYLQEGTELLELEELQGISGLKAMRVTVQYE